MQLNRLFKDNKLEGVLGIYPLTPENLMRVGLALCTLLKIEKECEKPTLSLDDINFLTMSLSVGFMYAGGDVVYGNSSANLFVRSSIDQDRGLIYFDDLNEEDLKKLEAILFSRYNIPKEEGEKIGKIWIRRERL